VKEIWLDIEVIDAVLN